MSCHWDFLLSAAKRITLVPFGHYSGKLTTIQEELAPTLLSRLRRDFNWRNLLPIIPVLLIDDGLWVTLREKNPILQERSFWVSLVGPGVA